MGVRRREIVLWGHRIGSSVIISTICCQNTKHFRLIHRRNGTAEGTGLSMLGFKWPAYHLLCSWY